MPLRLLPASSSSEPTTGGNVPSSIVLVIVIMMVYYRFSGFLAVVGLLFYGLTTLAILAGFDAVLTLPGLAGFVLSIGMAVDANFLIFERIREELVAGKSVRHAIDEGFKHAWSAIVDTHVTTALTAANMLFEAIEDVAMEDASGTTWIPRAGLRERLFATADFAGLTGTLTCSPTGDCGAPVIGMYQLTAGGPLPTAPIWP